MQRQKAKRVFMASVASVSLAAVPLGATGTVMNVVGTFGNTHTVKAVPDADMTDERLFLQLQHQMDPAALDGFSFPSMNHDKMS